MKTHRFKILGGICLGAILLSFGAGAAPESQAIELAERPPGVGEPQISWVGVDGQAVSIQGSNLGVVGSPDPVVRLGGWTIDIHDWDPNSISAWIPYAIFIYIAPGTYELSVEVSKKPSNRVSLKIYVTIYNLTATTLEAGDPNCYHGGSAFVWNGNTTYVCNGAPGANGANGKDGAACDPGVIANLQADVANLQSQVTNLWSMVSMISLNCSIVQQTQPVCPGCVLTLNAACPVGHYATGGGYYLESGIPPGTIEWDVLSSSPSAGGPGWSVTVKKKEGNAANIVVYSVCCIQY